VVLQQHHCTAVLTADKVGLQGEGDSKQMWLAGKQEYGAHGDSSRSSMVHDYPRLLSEDVREEMLLRGYVCRIVAAELEVLEALQNGLNSHSWLQQLPAQC
jgi:hypothetical protein